MDPYKVLGIDQDASAEEIETAFREKSEKFHPDNGGEAWVYEQIQEAFAALTKKNDTEEDPATPPPPPLILAEEDAKEPSVDAAGFSEIKTRTPKGKASVAKKKDGSKAIIIGAVLGGITALPFLFYVLTIINKSPADNGSGDSANSSEQRSNDSSQRRRNDRRNNRNDRLSNRSNQERTDRLTIPPVEEQDDEDPEKTDDDNSALSDASSDLDEDLNPPDEPGTESDNDFWSVLQSFEDRFYETDRVASKTARLAAQREWLEELRENLDGEEVQFSFRIVDSTVVRRGRYQLLLSDLKMGSYVANRRGSMTIAPTIEVRRKQSEIDELTVNSRLIIEGNVYISAPDKQLNLNSNQYFGVFQIHYRGRNEDVVITFAVKNPTLKYE